MWTALQPLSNVRNYLPSVLLPFLIKEGQKIKFVGEDTPSIKIPNNDTVFLLEKDTELKCLGYIRGYYSHVGKF